MATIHSGYLKTKNGVQLMSTNPYPIGAIYLSVEATDPSKLFGGTWEQITDRFLLGTGSNEANNSTYFGTMNAGAYSVPVGELGGQDFHTLTVDEMPRHKHATEVHLAYDGGGVNSIQGSNGKYDWADTNPLNDFPAAAGGDKAHNNILPYLAVYMWKRTA